jgi:hypothetical protein
VSRRALASPLEAPHELIEVRAGHQAERRTGIPRRRHPPMRRARRFVTAPSFSSWFSFSFLVRAEALGFRFLSAAA